MSAALPPVPDLIPISVLRKGSQCSSSSASSCSDYSTTVVAAAAAASTAPSCRYADSDSGRSSSSSSAWSGSTTSSSSTSQQPQHDDEDVQVAASCRRRRRVAVEVMGEQRSRRTKHAAAAAAVVIDTPPPWSRGQHGAAPGASRKTERHRKSDRRRDRDRDRERHTRSSSTKRLQQQQQQNAITAPSTSSPSPPTTTTTAAAPRVNPIFVWVRQQDTHIVEVKCEDYDKRNRILLTKTAQGWRAIPRTETLAPVLHKDDAPPPPPAAAKHGKKVKKRSNGSKPPKRKSFGVQVDEDDLLLTEDASAWSGDEAMHDICCTPTPSPARDVTDRECAHKVVSGGGGGTQDECQNNISPLDNLLAVAELEFNQQIEAERWETTNNNNNKTNVQEDLDIFIESCNAPTGRAHDDKLKTQDDCECDYNEEDDNNIGMDDILSRLEQSLRSPDSLHNDIDMMIKEDLDNLPKSGNAQEVGEEKASPETTSGLLSVDVEDEISASVIGRVPDIPAADPTTLKYCDDVELQPTDLSVQATQSDDLVPTDLSIPKCLTSPLTKRPPSQNSETIQSPQPSGIPAVPPSPDLLYSSANHKNSSKSNIYLESLLSPTTTKSDAVAVVLPDKEPLNLGKMRDSDSPKVTCSQEEEQPPSKKIRIEDITLKTLLDKEQKAQMRNAATKRDTPKLLELLSQDEDEMIEHDPLTQLKHVLLNAALSIPDPMLIPKDRLSQILASPAREIPKLLKLRPELRLPEALAYPHLLQDPDILVITLSQLKMIIEKQSQSLPVVEKEKVQQPERRKECRETQKTKEKVRLTIPDPSMQHQQQVARKPTHTPPKERTTTTTTAKERIDVSKTKKGSGELTTDFDAATTNAAFSQMMWLPYLNQLEAMNNPEFLKFLTTMLPSYPTEMSHMMRPFPPPPPFPIPHTPPPLNYSPLEMSMWQEMMLQARAKNQFDLLGAQQKLFAKAPINSLPPYTPPFAPRPMPPQYTTQPSSAKYGSKTKTTSAAAVAPTSYHQHQSAKGGGVALGYHHPHREATSHYGYEQHIQRQKQQQQQGLMKHQQDLHQKPRVACKPFANLVQPNLRGLQGFAALSPSPTSLQQQQQQLHHQQMEQYRQYQQLQQPEKRRNTAPGQGQGPIDLSGATSCPMPGKLKVKQTEHLVDPKRLLKYDDIAEVGSTTTIDEMVHDQQKHLWHPLFGNQKSYTSPWNWTSVTATGE